MSVSSKDKVPIAVFISCHGFGHAARVSAVMDAMALEHPGCEFHIFSRVPEWFFARYAANYTHHSVRTDIGFIQKDALSADFDATRIALARFFPFDQSEAYRCVCEKVDNLNCELVVSDISAVGLVVAQELGLPSVLMENFTWQWMYSNGPLGPSVPDIVSYLDDCTSRATMHIQMTPCCDRQPHLALVNPVARKPVQSRRWLLQQLELNGERDIILVSMGGTPHSMQFLTRLQSRWPQYDIVVSGHEERRFVDNLRLLEASSGLDHPSLVNIASLVIAKLGYSTIAETYWGGPPMAAFTRHDSPEMAALEHFFHQCLRGRIVNTENDNDDDWIEEVDTMIHLGRVDRSDQPRGEDQIANRIAAHMGWTTRQ